MSVTLTKQSLSHLYHKPQRRQQVVTTLFRIHCMTTKTLHSIQLLSRTIHLTTDFLPHSPKALSFPQPPASLCLQTSRLISSPKLAGRALNSPIHICGFCTSIMIYDQCSISPSVNRTTTIALMLLLSRLHISLHCFMGQGRVPALSRVNLSGIKYN